MIKYDCGCIALAPMEGERGAQIISSCDKDNNKFSLFLRNMGGKAFEKVPTEKANLLFEELAKLVADGNNFRQLKSLLR